MILLGGAWHHFHLFWLEEAPVRSVLLGLHPMALLTLAKGTNQVPVPANTSPRGTVGTPSPDVFQDGYCRPGLAGPPHSPSALPMVSELHSARFQLANLINPFGLVGVHGVRWPGVESQLCSKQPSDLGAT